MHSPSIGFVGAGQMARALAAGFVRSGLITPDRICAADPLEAVLIVGLASFAIGWVLRRLQEPAATTPRRAASTRAARPARRRTS